MTNTHSLRHELALLPGYGAGLGAFGIWLGLGSGILMASAALLLRLRYQLTQPAEGSASADPAASTS